MHWSEHMEFFIANKVLSVMTIPIVYLHDDLKVSLKGFMPALLWVVMNDRLRGTMERRVDEERRWF